jgi:hypothetical protein
MSRLSVLPISASLLLATAAARADVGCGEMVTEVIMHSNGNVYFTTDQTCGGWCTISYATADANKMAYALLLSANAQAKRIWFDWPNLTNCSQQNQPYSVPAFMELGQ